MDKIDISNLTAISVNLNNIDTSNLSDNYSPYSLYIETRDGSDQPNEYICNLYELFKSGIDNIAQNNKGDVIIGEKIISHSQMIMSQTQFDNILATQFGKADDVIEYDKIIEFVQELNSEEDFDVITGKIYNWFSDLVGLDFSINENPENADDSNLILPQKMTQYIKEIAESILSKLYRNLTQLIRVVHEYRLYGEGATIFGGVAEEFKNSKNIGKWSALPDSSWTEYSGNYVVGKTAYTEDVGEIKTGFINNQRYAIGPYNSFGISPHTHEVKINSSEMPSTFSYSRRIWKSFEKQPTHISRVDNADKRIGWLECAKSALIDHDPAGFGDKGEDNGSVKSKSSWQYSWSSNEACKLMSPSNGAAEIFQKSNTTLPTYESYVWQWHGADNINITDPTKNMRG